MPLPLSSPTGAPSSEQRRRSHRARCLLQGSCVFNDGASTLDVIVRNISQTGARIVGNELICLPKAFELRIIDTSGGYSSKKARIIWRTEAAAGVAFVD